MICFTNMLSAQQQNGISAAEGSPISSPASPNDYLWADSAGKRWKVSNNGGATQALSVWACPTQSGGIVYSVAPTNGSDMNTETCLSLPAIPTSGIPLLIGSSAPQWGAANLDIQGNALVSEISPNSTNLPQTNQLVVLNTVSGNSTVANAGTSSTAIVEGICMTNCNNAALVPQIARAGIAGCKFYNTTNAGDYVQSSLNTGGYCQDMGSNYPTNGRQVIGRVLGTDSGTTGHVVNIVLYAADVIATIPSSGNGTKYQTTNVVTATSGDVATYDGNGNVQDGGAALRNSLIIGICGGTVGAGTTGTAYIFWPSQTSLTTCTATNTTTSYELIMPFACTAKNLFCQAQTAGVSASKIVLYKNGTASTLSCPLGTSTSASDTTDTVSFNGSTDTWSIRAVTGQASDPMTNLRASFECQ